MNFKIRYSIFFLFVGCCIQPFSGAFAQKRTIDSLKHRLLTNTINANTIAILNNISDEYRNEGNYDSATFYAYKMLGISQLFLQNANTLEKQLDGQKCVANAYSAIGNVLADIGKYNESLTFYDSALSIANEIKNEYQIARIIGNKGSVFVEQSNYDSALYCLQKAMKINEKNNIVDALAMNYGNVGSIYFEQKNYDKSLFFYNKALALSQQQSAKMYTAVYMANIGGVYTALAKDSMAVDFLNKALKIAEEINFKQLQINIIGTLGDLYSHKKDFTQAFYFLDLALKMDEANNDKESVARGQLSIAKLFIEQKKYGDAYDFVQKAIRLNKEIGAKNALKLCYETMSELLEKSTILLPNDFGNRFKSFEEMRLAALFFHKQFMQLNDSLFNEANEKKLIQREMNYEFDKKEADIKLKNEKEKIIIQTRNRLQNIVIIGISCGLIAALILAFFIFRTLQTTRKQKLIIESQKKEVEKQKLIIEEKNKDITDSIHYAERIQKALLKEEEHVSAHLPEHFILFKPKDIVSGDFYWAAELSEFFYFAVADCTGHGVPGAIMSMLGISILDDIVSHEETPTPARILDKLRERIIRELRQENQAVANRDGMDISLCMLNLKTLELNWAGANNPLTIVRNNTIEETKADKQPVGYHPTQKPFTNHRLHLQKGDCIYIYSDGYADQFGGLKGKKLTYKRFESYIITNHTLPMKEQKELFLKQFMEWKGNLEQIDDVCLIGMKM